MGTTKAKMTNGGAVVVTGASRGLGLALASLLAALDVPLVLVSRGQAQLEKVARQLSSTGTLVRACAAHVADENAMHRAFETAKELGPLAGVVNNAGTLEPVAPIAELDIGAFEEHLRTNITGVAVTTKLALQHRDSSEPMRIINISSGAATHGYRSWAAYCASKAAVNLITEVTAAEHVSQLVSCVAVAPGVIETRMQRYIRTLSQEQFPDVARFRHMKESNALLSPVDASMALAWLVLVAPLELSGQFIDARDSEMAARVRSFRSDEAKHLEPALAMAREWVHALEPGD